MLVDDSMGSTNLDWYLSKYWTSSKARILSSWLLSNSRRDWDSRRIDVSYTPKLIDSLNSSVKLILFSQE